MSSEQATPLDPRFDPVFQRGFDGSEVPSTPAPPAPPVDKPDPAPTAPTAQTAWPAVAMPGPVPAPVEPDIAPAAADPQGAVTITPLEPQHEVVIETAPAVGSIARNPFFVALAVVAVLLIAAGIWIFAQSGVAFNSAQVQSQGDFMSLDALIHVAPFVALLGLATAIGLLFVLAARYRRNR